MLFTWEESLGKYFTSKENSKTIYIKKEKKKTDAKNN